MILTRVALALSLFATTACVTRDTVAAFRGGAPSCGLPVLRDGRCTGQLASVLFERALCGCRVLDFSPGLSTDGFDSRVAPWAPDGGGGDVGGNWGLRFPGVVEVGGDLLIAQGGIEAGTRLMVGNDLRVQGGLGRSSSQVIVGGSASIGGDVDVGALDVAGVLTMPSTASARGVVNPVGGRQTAEVSVAPPCRCDAASGVDVAAVVEAHRESNDDEAIGLVPTAFASLSGDSTQELPCGLYFLDGVGGQGTLTIHVTGRAAVFVRGDHAPLAVQLDQGAELDLFVEGELHLAPSQLGDPSRPTALRLYSASAIGIDLSQVALSALLYAPDVTITSSALRELFGSLVVGNVIGGWGGKLALHHDRAVASLGAACW